MDIFTALQVSASGLRAQRTRMDVAASNLANSSTTRTPEGGPYQRRNVVLTSTGVDGSLGGFSEVQGVAVQSVQPDDAEPRLEYDPSHPDANEQGFVAYPNVNPIEEMVDMITASRAYEAGLSAVNTEVAMAESALQIGGR